MLRYILYYVKGYIVFFNINVEMRQKGEISTEEQLLMFQINICRYLDRDAESLTFIVG